MDDDEIAAELERELADLSMGEDEDEDAEDEDFFASFAKHVRSAIETTSDEAYLGAELDQILASSTTLTFAVPETEARGGLAVPLNEGAAGDDAARATSAASAVLGAEVEVEINVEAERAALLSSDAEAEATTNASTDADAAAEVNNVAAGAGSSTVDVAVEVAAALTRAAEECAVLRELMELMLDAVEQCAPICSPAKALGPAPPTLDLLLRVITDDADVLLNDLESGGNTARSCVAAGETQAAAAAAASAVAVMQIEGVLRQDAQAAKTRAVAQQQATDLAMWGEAQQYNEAIEANHRMRAERLAKREQAAREARRDRAAVQVQSLCRGRAARRSTSDQLEQHRAHLLAAQVQQEAVAARAAEAVRREARRQVAERELRECLLMSESETQCRAAWLAERAAEQRRSAMERGALAAEDALAVAVRGAERVVLEVQARRAAAYEGLQAQPDEEYADLDFSDDDEEEEGEEAEAEVEAEAEAEAEAALVAGARGADPLLPPRTQTTPSAPVPTAPTAELPSSRPRLGVRRAENPVLLDPTGGRSWGGSYSAANGKAPAPFTAEGAGAGVAESTRLGDSASPSEGAVDLLPSAATATAGTIGSANTAGIAGIAATGTATATHVSTQPHTHPASLQAHWLQVAAEGRERQGVDRAQFSASAAAKAGALLSGLFGHSDSCSGRSEGASASVPASVPVQPEHDIIAGLRCWAAAWTSRDRGEGAEEPAPRGRDGVLETGETGEAEEAGEEGEELGDSLLDLATDPLLARELDLCVEGLSGTRFLKRFRNLTKLVLNVNRIRSLCGVSALTQLVSLSAKDNKISSLPLARLTHLRYLHLDANNISDLSSLSGLHCLRTLTASSNQLTHIPVLRCAGLQRLELFRNSIALLPAHCLDGLPRLQHLDLSSNLLTSADGEALSQCALLQTLILSQNQLTSVPGPLRLPLLKNLWLNGNRIANLNPWKLLAPSDPISGTTTNATTNGSACPQWPLSLPSLQKLILRDNQLSSLHAELFRATPLLGELDLSFNALPTRETVGGIRYCGLLSLHLQDNPFTTIAVNTTAGSTTRAALPETEQAVLGEWLLRVCPSLETVSGNKVYRQEDKGARGSQLLLHFEAWGVWPALGGLGGLKGQAAGGLGMGVGHQAGPTRTLTHLLQLFGVALSAAASRERVAKRAQGQAAKGAKSTSIVSGTSGGSGGGGVSAYIDVVVDWEEELASLLEQHCNQLSSFVDALGGDAHPEVFLSFLRTPAGSATATPSASASASIPQLTTAAQAHEVTAAMQKALAQTQAQTQKRVARVFPQPGAVALQSAFRGRRARRRVTEALRSVRYEDDELDDLFAADMDFAFDAELSFLQEQVGPLEGRGGGAGRGTDSQDVLASPALVYGDHIRRRRQKSQEAGAEGERVGAGGMGADTGGSIYTSKSKLGAGAVDAHTGGWVLPEGSHSPIEGRSVAQGYSQGQGHSKGQGYGHSQSPGYGYSQGRGYSAHDPDSFAATEYSRSMGPGGDVGGAGDPSRPSTGMSTISTASARTDYSHTLPDGVAAGMGMAGAGVGKGAAPGAGPVRTRYNAQPPPSARSEHTQSSQAARQEALAQEWGISDPRVLAAMLKRNQRMKGFSSAKEREAALKDPQARYEKFLKNANQGASSSASSSFGAPVGSSFGNTSTSGSFGGKPKTQRGAQKTRKQFSVPAWMVGDEEKD
ncbi:hypothetical protein B484DRAFT_443235 [Ochromonadaceae sp. CCMP2298]|nr:hypothetical protein B484DRAFT_443235 [Ochromonadaceae sp. CCMP2298]